MPDQPNNPRKPLSEISHLFLSHLREQAGEGRSRPVRIPPGSKPASSDNDLSPDELGQLDGPTDVVRRRRVTGIIGHHLNGHLVDRSMQFASALAAAGERVGMILIDASEFRLMIAEKPMREGSSDEAGVLDARRMSDALLEINEDVDRWLLITLDPRCNTSRALMEVVDDWVLLATCDHDGMVSGYRALKTMAEGPKSPLSIALLEARDDEQSQRVFEKLTGVCRQFLDWEPEFAPTPHGPVEHVVATVLACRSIRDKAQLAQAPQWKVVEDFLRLPADQAADEAHFGSEQAEGQVIEADATPEPTLVETTEPVRAAPRPVHEHRPEPEPMRMTPAEEGVTDIIELPDGVSVLSAYLRRGGQLLPTPIQPEMCPGASIAVARDRAITVVAQIGPGLAGLSSIASALQWVESCRKLIAMALPQVAVDAERPVRVDLLVDHADRNAQGLEPLFGQDRIRITTYRRVRFAGRSGLLLEAA
jgi:hypothetical protein